MSMGGYWLLLRCLGLGRCRLRSGRDRRGIWIIGGRRMLRFVLLRFRCIHPDNLHQVYISTNTAPTNPHS